MNVLRSLRSLIVDKYSFLPQDEDTIISFKSPHRLRDLCIPASDLDTAYDRSIDHQLFRIRMVNSKGQREAASLLIKKKYSWRGYSVDAPLENAPNRITLIAETGNEIVGTMTLCLDGGIALPAD